MTRISVVEWPDGLLPRSKAWEKIKADVDEAQADLLITNEMPFGNWVPTSRKFDKDAAARWSDLHEAALGDLTAIGAARVLSSRPILADGFLINEASLFDQGNYRFLDHKHLFQSNRLGWGFVV